MASLPPTSSPWWHWSRLSGEPVLTAGRPYRCRSTIVHGASGVAGHEIASAMDTPPVPYVAGALAVVPRPPERRYRSGHRGRGWERPPIEACLDRHRAGWRCTSPSASPPRGRSQPTVRPGRVSRVASRRWRTRCPTTWPPGCPASPTKAGTRLFRLAVWPSRMGLMDRERPQARLGWPCTSRPSPCRTKHPEGWVAPVNGRKRPRATAATAHSPQTQ